MFVRIMTPINTEWSNPLNKYTIFAKQVLMVVKANYFFSVYLFIYLFIYFSVPQSLNTKTTEEYPNLNSV